MRRLNLFSTMAFLGLTCLSFGQTINLTGTIYEAEFTPDNKICGLFTYMNNSSLSVLLEVTRGKSSSSEVILSRTVESRRGRQLRVFEQQFTSAEEQVYGDYSISFYLLKDGTKSDLILTYNNKDEFAPNLRVVSVMLNEVKEDGFGKYFEVRIDWQTIREGTETDIRKCYLKNL